MFSEYYISPINSICKLTPFSGKLDAPYTAIPRLTVPKCSKLFFPNMASPVIKLSKGFLCQVIALMKHFAAALGPKSAVSYIASYEAIIKLRIFGVEFFFFQIPGIARNA